MEPVAGKDAMGHGGLPSGADILAAIVKTIQAGVGCRLAAVNGPVFTGTGALPAQGSPVGAISKGLREKQLNRKRPARLDEGVSGSTLPGIRFALDQGNASGVTKAKTVRCRYPADAPVFENRWLAARTRG